MRKKVMVCLAVGAMAGAAQGALADDGLTTSNVVVVGVTPMMGSGIDINKVAGNVQVINPAADRDKNPASLADMLDDRLGSISVNDYNGNQLQESINFRGFSASPLIGQAQGLAVYQNGMRINEAFGDVVLWDLNPSFAVDRIQVMPGANPVYGLNALGGAIALKMKDGFTNPGTMIDVGGGSFGRVKATVETGRQWGDYGVYAGVSAVHDDGWRDRSPSQGVQSYTDLAVRKDDWDGGLGITFGATSLTGNGGTPTGLLDQSWSSIFTAPDLQQNLVVAANLHLAYQFDDTLSAQGGLYYRHLRTGLHNGNALVPSTACNGGQCVDAGGNNIPASDNADIINSIVSSDSFGVNGQLTQQRPLWGHDNSASVGASSDVGFTHYVVNTEVGTLDGNRVVQGNGTYLGTGQGYDALLNTVNQYYGVFVTDTFSVTERLNWTLSGRYNVALIDLTDLAGQGLTGNHYYQRFNPATGLTYQITPKLNTYISYAEANRAPTPAELGCSDPSAPCTVQSALNSDPNLKQVVSRSVEAGIRGKEVWSNQGNLDWNLGVFGSRNYDDIIFVMTDPTSGQGYFNNAGITQRKGLEAAADAEFGRLKLAASYAYTLATFESNNLLDSQNNTAANGNGQIQVIPGDRMPGIPLHSLKASIGYQLTDNWSVGADTKISTQRTLLGDESNTMPRLGGINVVDANTSYMLTKGALLYFRVQNLFDQRYASSGTVADPTGGGVITSTSGNTEFLVPGQPLTFWAGMRVTF